MFTCVMCALASLAFAPSFSATAETRGRRGRGGGAPKATTSRRSSARRSERPRGGRRRDGHGKVALWARPRPRADQMDADAFCKSAHAGRSTRRRSSWPTGLQWVSCTSGSGSQTYQAGPGHARSEGMLASEHVRDQAGRRRRSSTATGRSTTSTRPGRSTLSSTLASPSRDETLKVRQGRCRPLHATCTSDGRLLRRLHASVLRRDERSGTYDQEPAAELRIEAWQEKCGAQTRT